MKKIFIVCSGKEMGSILTETGKTQMENLAREIPVLFSHKAPLIICGHKESQKDSAEIIRTALGMYTPKMESGFVDVDSKELRIVTSLWEATCIDFLYTLQTDIVAVVGMQLFAMLPVAFCKQANIAVNIDHLVSNIVRGQAFFIDLEGKSIRRFMN